MSLDVYLRGPKVKSVCICTRCENEHEKEEEVTYYEDNITHNLGGMASEAGLYKYLWRPEEVEAKIAKDIIPRLENGLVELLKHPEYYKSLNPSNGWGHYEGLVDFVRGYLKACREHPEAEIRVSR
jgi:hypothetical protein